MASGNVCVDFSPQRSFVYSSLRRLISATNPESGTTNYSYDPNGNLATRTVGGITTNYSYNELDQISGKIYSDSNSAAPTPWPSYAYNHGWLTTVTAGTTVNQYGFDGLGRVNSSSQTTNGTSYPFQYSYNLADGVTSTTFVPSGRVVTTSYDTAGRPYSLQGTIGSSSTNYVTGTLYASSGPVRQLSLGNGLVETTTFNSRFQPTQVQAGNLLTLQYGYNPTQNNGNVASQTIARSGVGNWTQSYTYDGANRLSNASESGSGWSENYGYDDHGRLASRTSGILPTPSLETPVDRSWFWANNQSNNQINGINGWSYDGAGNVAQVSSMSRTFTYDAESRQRMATINGQVTTYDYDGGGRRVRTVALSWTTVYVYDALGQLAAEYSTAPSNGNGLSYLTTDPLGSTRLVTDAGGVTKKCYDYLPFGEEIPNGFAGGRVAMVLGPIR